MNLNILLKRHQVFYNLHIAERIGLLSAIYIQFLLDMKDCLKDKWVDGKYFILSRQQIADSTAMSDESIEKVESNLLAWNLIELKPVRNNSDKSYYALNEDLLMKVIESSKEELLNVVTKPGQKKVLIPTMRKAPMSARQQGINNLKLRVEERDTLVREAICNWIDGVYSNPKGFLSKSGIDQQMILLEDYTKGDKKLKKEILKIATTNGQRDLNWAISNYEKKMKDLKLENKFSREQLVSNIDAINDSDEVY